MKIKERYITDKNGNPSDVVISLEEYKLVLADLEELESIRAYDAAVSSGDEIIQFEQAISEIKRSVK